MVSVNVTIAMPPEMLEEIDDAAGAHGMSRAMYVRHLIRQAEESPFDEPNALDDSAENQKGAA
jgi:metal-responsive CopG/Arc/MetJ family transcriptional regulator